MSLSTLTINICAEFQDFTFVFGTDNNKHRTVIPITASCLIMETINNMIMKQIAENEKKFHLACDQVMKLNELLDNNQTRYDRANSANQRTARYGLRMKLSVLEGVRNMYVEYASMKAEELMLLQCQLCDDITSHDSDYDSDGEN